MKEKALSANQFMLISLCEIQIGTPRVFDSKEEAFDAMLEEYSDKSDVPSETLKRHFTEGSLEDLSEEFRDEYGITESSAWIIDGPNHDNYIWEICCLTMQDNRIIRCE